MNKHWYIEQGQHCNLYKKCSCCQQVKHRTKDFSNKVGSNGKGKGKVPEFRTNSRCKLCTNRKKKISRKFKPVLIEQYGHICQYCKKETPYNSLGIDHKTPVVKGGTDDLENLILACNSCNTDKGILTHEEYIQIIENMV